MGKNSIFIERFNDIINVNRWKDVRQSKESRVSTL